FSSAELLRLLSCEDAAQAAFKIELSHVEDEPRIASTGGAPEKNPPQIRAFGFVRSHRCVVRARTIRTTDNANDYAVVRITYLAPERDRTIPLEVLNKWREQHKWRLHSTTALRCFGQTMTRK